MTHKEDILVVMHCLETRYVCAQLHQHIFGSIITRKQFQL